MFRRAAVLSLVTLCSLAPAAGAVVADSGIVSYPARWSNYSHRYRAPRLIRMIVVHVAEGSWQGTVDWFRNPRAHASANYVVGREGEIAAMVPDTREAWHAGNAYVNLHSIGIEHEGYSAVDGVFTDAEYRASARLVASLVRRYRIPLDRAHVIGHSQVPDPYHRGEYGGFAHHTDPGAYWNWTRYWGYVRSYVAGVTPPPLPFDVTIPDVGLGQTLTGVVDWEALPAGADPAAKVDFFLDGKLVDTQTEAPWLYGGAGWDSTLVANGRHVLSVRATAADGRTASASVVVKTWNPPLPPPVISSTGITDGSTVSGVVQWQPVVTGAVSRVELWIDGAVRSTTAPYAWDTTKETPGPHTLAVRAVGPRGAATVALAVVTVAAPPPTP